MKFQGPLTARPAAVDLRPFCSSVEDQADIGSCTANAAAALVETNQIRAGRKAVAADGIADEIDALAETAEAPLKAPATVTVSNVATASTGVVTFTTTITPASPATPPTPTPTPTPAPGAKFINVSRLFTYYATRKIEGTTESDDGAYIRDAIKSMAKYGMVDELSWPYVTSKFAVNPPSEIWSAAAKAKITSYHSISDGDLETMKVTLAKGYLIEYGFDVYTAFLTADMAKKGMLCRPKGSESLQGGHAVALCGYDDNKVMPDGSVGAFLARNSWSARWGQAGYFWHAYNYVGDTKLCSDFWAIVSQPL
jgi:C1A family cysteine protease